MSTAHDIPESQASIATLSRGILCAFCGVVEVQKSRHGSPQKFCSSKCRFRAWDREHPRQKRLDLAPPAEPVQPLGGGPTTQQIRAAQKRQTVRVLRMLQDAGPSGVATGDFLRAGVGRFGARIAELAPFWLIERRREHDHGWRYVLEGKR